MKNRNKEEKASRISERESGRYPLRDISGGRYLLNVVGNGQRSSAELKVKRSHRFSRTFLEVLPTRVRVQPRSQSERARDRYLTRRAALSSGFPGGGLFYESYLMVYNLPSNSFPECFLSQDIFNGY